MVVEGASCDPKTARIIPGAYICLNEPAFVEPDISGCVPADAANALRISCAVTVAALPLYVAVIVCDASDCGFSPISLPVTASVAVAIPFEPRVVPIPVSRPRLL